MTACLNIAAFFWLSAALACKHKERLVTVIPVSTAGLILVLFALALFRALYLIAIILVVDGHTPFKDMFDWGGLFGYYSFHLMLFTFGSGYLLS